MHTLYCLKLKRITRRLTRHRGGKVDDGDAGLCVRAGRKCADGDVVEVGAARRERELQAQPRHLVRLQHLHHDDIHFTSTTLAVGPPLRTKRMD